MRAKNGGKTEQRRGRGKWHMVKQNNRKHKHDQQRANGKQSLRTEMLKVHVVHTHRRPTHRRITNITGLG